MAPNIARSLLQLGICSEVASTVQAAVSDCRDLFDRIDEIQASNYHKVLAAFRRHRVSETDLWGTTGYGYGDLGRDKLDAIFAQAFGGDDALVRSQFVSGTHAISTVLFALLRPGDTLLFIGGPPYDTLRAVIGTRNRPPAGNLISIGVHYEEIPFGPDGTLDEQLLAAKLSASPRVCMLQRSRGYSTRPSLSVEEIGRLCSIVKTVSPESVTLVDDCYGEFVELREPTEVGADAIVGSLMKNPGGGIAPSGGYVAGKEWIVEAAATRLTAPGLGRECGPTLGTNRDYLRGIFLAPSVTGEAVKGAVLAARVMEMLGFETYPKSSEPRSDIVQAIRFHCPEQLISFCRGVQAAGPVDAAFEPEPSPMPGYDDQIIMASPSFVQGSSIELSCDGPLRQPYCAFLQGGLYWHHTVTGVAVGLQRMIDDDNLRI